MLCGKSIQRVYPSCIGDPLAHVRLNFVGERIGLDLEKVSASSRQYETIARRGGDEHSEPPLSFSHRPLA